MKGVEGKRLTYRPTDGSKSSQSKRHREALFGVEKAPKMTPPAAYFVIEFICEQAIRFSDPKPVPDKGGHQGPGKEKR